MSEERLDDGTLGNGTLGSINRGAEGDTDRGAMSNTSDGKLERARAKPESAHAGPIFQSDDELPSSLTVPAGRVGARCSACNTPLVLRLSQTYDKCPSCGASWSITKYCTQCGHLLGGHYAGCPLITVKSSWTGVTDPHFYRSPAPLRSLTGAEEKLEPLSAQHQHDADCDCPAEEDYQDFDPKDYRCGTFAEPRADQCDECNRGIEHAMHCKIGIRNQQRALEILKASDEFQPRNCNTCGVRSGYHAVGCPDAPQPAKHHVNLEHALGTRNDERYARTNGSEYAPLADDIIGSLTRTESKLTDAEALCEALRAKRRADLMQPPPLFADPWFLIPFGCGLLIGAVGCWVLTR